ncbi:MAG: SusC/RagA family TonB-linked outer membrane protein [Candidatus Cryptobacteroides sp.]
MVRSQSMFRQPAVLALITGLALLLSGFRADAQQIGGKMLIQGKVVDEENIPIAGVSVIVPMSAIGAVTDVEGLYSIEVPKTAKVLEFSFLGLKTQQVQINSRSLINVVMYDDAEVIESVVVTGYGNIARESYTGSASVMSSGKIGDRAVSSVENVLRGNVAGAIVSTTGQPGETSEVRLRGVGSMNASNQPLYVVDGVIWDLDNVSGTDMSANNPLNALNPSDIESATILKDAASASLYGSRGANGVIVITTKKGEKSDKVSINLSLQGGISMMQRCPDLVSGREFADLWVEGKMHANIRNEMLKQSGASSIPQEDLIAVLKELYLDKDGYTYNGLNFNEYQKIARQQFNALFQMPAGNGTYRTYDYFGDDYDKLPDTDWYDEISRVAPFMKGNLSVSGGSKSLTYYASLEYYDQQGIILNSKLQREAIRIKLSSDDTRKFLNWGLNSYISNSVQTGPMTGGTSYSTPMYAALRLPSVIPAFLEDGSYNFAFPSNILNTNHNPVASAKENENRKPQLNITVSGNVRLNFAKWLYLTSNASVYYLGLRRKTYYDSTFGSGYQYGGLLTERNVNRAKIANTTMLFFDKTFNKHHKVGVSAGIELEKLDYKYNQTTVSNFINDESSHLSDGSVITDWDGGGYGYSQFSVITKADYSWRSRYYISGSFRQDRSSRFSKENRTGNFWSASGAWRISKENFWKNLLQVVNTLKIKGSYGINGNLPSSWYNTNLYAPVSNADAPGAYLSSVAYDGLTWEENAIWNVGIDAGFLHDRIRLSAEYYRRKTKNLLIDLPVSNTSGFSYKLQNISSAGIDNQGVEIELNTSLVETPVWNWTFSANIATLRARYFGLPESYIDSRQRQIIANGYSPNTWWLREFAGIDEETGRQMYWKYNEDGTREKVTSTSGLEYRPVGKQGIPKYTGGFSTSLSYRRLEASALFSFAGGFYIYDRQAAYTEDDGNQLGSVSVNQLDRWTPLHTDATAPLRIEGYSSQSRTTRFLKKGDYLKLRNISLSYTLPDRWLRPYGIRKTRFFVQAENLWVLTKIKDYDPELSIDGYRNYDTYPFAVTITGGVSLNF